MIIYLADNKSDKNSQQNVLHFLSLYYSAPFIEHTFKCLWLQCPLFSFSFSLSWQDELAKESSERIVERSDAAVSKVVQQGQGSRSGRVAGREGEEEEEEEGEVKPLRQTRKPLWEAQLEHKQKHTGTQNQTWSEARVGELDYISVI